MKEKALVFAYEFDKEGRRRMVDIFPSSLAFISLGAQDQLPNLYEPMKTKSVGHKSVGPLVQDI